MIRQGTARTLLEHSDDWDLPEGLRDWALQATGAKADWRQILARALATQPAPAHRRQRLHLAAAPAPLRPRRPGPAPRTNRTHRRHRRRVGHLGVDGPRRPRAGVRRDRRHLAQSSPRSGHPGAVSRRHRAQQPARQPHPRDHPFGRARHRHGRRHRNRRRVRAPQRSSSSPTATPHGRRHRRRARAASSPRSPKTTCAIKSPDGYRPSTSPKTPDRAVPQFKDDAETACRGHARLFGWWAPFAVDSWVGSGSRSAARPVGGCAMGGVAGGCCGPRARGDGRGSTALVRWQLRACR